MMMVIRRRLKTKRERKKMNTCACFDTGSIDRQDLFSAMHHQRLNRNKCRYTLLKMYNHVFVQLYVSVYRQMGVL